MEVKFTPEQESELARIASQIGTSAETLVRSAALRLLQPGANGPAGDLPVLHLGEVRSLHRRDIYDDVA